MKISFGRMASRVRGIGLLELMLTLAILGVMLVVAVRYYGSASNAQEASALVNDFTTIKAAVENYLADNPATTSTSFPDLAKLVQQGYLPSSFSVTNKQGIQPAPNQWGGLVTVTAYQSGAMFKVAEAMIPMSVCKQAMGQLQSSLNHALGESAVAAPAKKGQGSGGASGGGTSSGGTSSGGGGKGATMPGSGATCGVSSTITVTYLS
ncbi:MAG: type II secretion system protein [Legionellales bacterium]|nr:type II secretion system protein [Legionellales bacterium]